MVETKWLVCGALMTALACLFAYLSTITADLGGWKGDMIIALACALFQLALLWVFTKFE